MNFPKAVKYLKQNDKIIEKIIDRIGDCDLKYDSDYFGSLVNSIIHQQLAIKAATTIHNRFLTEVKKLSPENALKLKDEQFSRAGISRQKKSYLLDLSLKFKELDIKNIDKLDDEQIIEILVKVKGIGRWTAEMFLIFSLNRLNVLPLDDLGFKKAVQINYKLKEMPSKDYILKISKKWGEYKTIAVWYLWQSLK